MLSISLFSQPAVATPKLLRTTLNARPGQSFAALMQQAEAAASQLIEQSFAQEADLRDVTVTVLGERNGQETPLFVVSVSRTNWQRQPQIRPWTTYFNNFSVALLGYRQPKAPQPEAIATSVAPASSDANRPVAPTANLPVKPSPSSANVYPSRTNIKDDPAYRDD